MFKKKEEGKPDAIYEINIKRGITSHFARTLKILQQKHLQCDGDDYIYSNDYSNNLCNALEAVFLHGMKDSVTQKLTSLISGAQNAESAASLNFWNVVTKFTHADVSSQLKSLAQITTDVGLCRAWVRLALNDGLMESYLHSMVVDEKTLKNYYQSCAYLRDHEQPGILKNYLTGLMSLELRLSFNSSVLNDWNNSTLLLAGVLDSNSAPPPTISEVDNPTASTAVMTSEPSNLLAMADSVPDIIEYSSSVRKKKEKDKKDEPIVVKKKDLGRIQVIPGGVGVKESMFSSIKDIEEIRRKGVSKTADMMSFSPSEDSTSSNISSKQDVESRLQDDISSIPLLESDNRQFNQANVDYDNLNSPTSHSNTKSACVHERTAPTVVPYAQTRLYSSETLVGSPVIVEAAASLEELYNSPRRPRSRRVNVDDLDQLSVRAENSWTTSDSTFTKVYLSESLAAQQDREAEGQRKALQENTHEARTDGKEQARPDSPFSPPASFSETSIYDSRSMRNYEDICADLPPIELDAAEQDAILKKVLQEMDIQENFEKAKKESRRRKEMATGALVNSKEGIWEERSINTARTASVNAQRKSESPPEPDQRIPSDHDTYREGEQLNIDETSESMITITDHFETEKQSEKIRGVSNPVNFEASKTSENNDVAASPGNIGNSLGSMTGWSSEMESSMEDTAKAARAESFATMLRTYQTTSNGHQTGTTMDEVIQSLAPDSDFTLLKEEQDQEFQYQDPSLSDYEILDSPTESMPGRLMVDSSRMIYVFRVPQENGLSHQNFTCRGCTRPIGIIYGPPRLCEFDGSLYCFECHENNESVLPSAVIYNWDFSKKKVSVQNYKFLQDLEDQPLYDIGDLNPKLYTHVSELYDLKCLREKLCFLKSYMFTCSQKSADALRQKVWPREHLYDMKDIYSLMDLGQVMSGGLYKLLKDVARFASSHVYDCPLCSQKGFVCEICGNPKVIYPFEMDTTVRCKNCKSVFHKTCLTESLPCPKCQRWGQRVSRGGVASSFDDHPEDYGMSPKL